MNETDDSVSLGAPALTNGPGEAAVLAAAVGCFALAVLAILGDKLVPIKTGLVFYKPTGPLSGVTTCAIFIWLCTWAILERRWHNETVAAQRINVIALGLLVLSLILTFPPVGDLF